MEFTDDNQLKVLRFLNNLDAMERSLHKEFELGRINKAKLTGMLQELADQKDSFYKTLETVPATTDDNVASNRSKFFPR